MPLPRRPQCGAALSEPELFADYRLGGDDYPWAGDKDRAELGGGLAAVGLSKGVKQYESL